MCRSFTRTTRKIIKITNFMLEFNQSSLKMIQNVLKTRRYKMLINYKKMYLDLKKDYDALNLETQKYFDMGMDLFENNLLLSGDRTRLIAENISLKDEIRKLKGRIHKYDN